MATFARSLRCLKTSTSNCMLTRAFNGQNPAKLGKAVDNDQCVVYFQKAASVVDVVNFHFTFSYILTVLSLWTQGRIFRKI
mgnify:CR=1 FL=1